MLRITRLTDNEVVTLELEGKLAGPWVDALGEVCPPDQALRLDLSGLSYIDPDGLGLLRELLARNVEVIASSPLVDEFLSRVGQAFQPDSSAARQAGKPDRRKTGAPPVATADRQVQQPDLQDFEGIVRSHIGRMLAVARRMLRSEEDAHDAVQEAFLSAFRSRDSFAAQSSLGTWLHRIVVNACLMKLRSRSRHPEAPLDDLLPNFDETEHHSRPVRSWTESAPTILLRQEKRDQVRACIDRLPATHRTILLLRDIEELDTEQTATALGIEPGAVKTRLHRARQALRTLLEPVMA